MRGKNFENITTYSAPDSVIIVPNSAYERAPVYRTYNGQLLSEMF